MVGHTGRLEPAIDAVQAVDLCIARFLPVVEDLGGALIVTADHGNADEMIELDAKSKKPVLDPSGKPRTRTSHTLNPVPFYVHAPSIAGLRIDASVQKPRLANVAATVLQLLGYQAPDDYERGLLAV
jgi:2,3-bisphosphoglycerate-independent phosphoglycerate mutase